VSGTPSDLLQSNAELAEQQQVTYSSTSGQCKKFARLYEKLHDAEDFADRVVQEAIICYCQFGKALMQRRAEIASEKQVDPESNADSRILNMEVRASFLQILLIRFYGRGSSRLRNSGSYLMQ
jgi:hypothetical protein